MINFKRLIQDEQGTEAYIEILDACVLGLRVETNGFQGGDSGHGGRTVLAFANIASVNLDIESDDYETRIILGGDAELYCLAEGLRFIADSLDAYRGKRA
jgi:hypothetical protein